MIRGLRRALGAGRWPERRPYAAARQIESFERAYWLVRIYYAVTLMFAYQEMRNLCQIGLNGGQIKPLWPVFWATDAAAAAHLLLFAIITSALLAVLLPDRRWPRVLVFLTFLEVSAFRSSFGFGAINHGNHYWLWLGLCFCFLPEGSRAEIGQSRNARFRYLLGFWFAQALIMLFYSMSGLWKIAAGAGDLLAGEFGGFHPDALAMIVSQKLLQLDQPTLLGPTIVENPWLGWPLHMWVFYVEFVALLVMFRPSLQRAWGVMLIVFHIGTLVLLGISFPKHVLVLTMLMIWSPFIARSYGLKETLGDLPGLAWLVRRFETAPSARGLLDRPRSSP